MNLLITKSCNRSCPYCFAQKEVELDSKQSSGNITLPVFQEYLDFLKNNSIGFLKLLGGEPTMHPQFEELVNMGLEQRFKVTVFTNGIWGERIRSFFSTEETQGVEFLINVNEKRHSSDAEYESLERSLKVIGQRGQLGFNIFVEDFDLTFLVPFINEFGLRRQIRLGVASPIVGMNNNSISTDRLRTIGKRLIEQMKLLEQRDVLVNFDCGFTYCMFEQDEFQTIIEATDSGLVSVCDFIGDVDYNLNVWPCFPLSKAEHLNLRDFETIDEIKQYYMEPYSQLKQFGSTEECLDCKYMLRKQCCGGCFARMVEEVAQNGDKQILKKLKMDL